MVDIYRTDRFGTPLGRLGYVSEAIRERKTDGTDTLDITCRTMCDKGDRIIFATPDGLAHEYEITDITHDRRDSLILSAHATGSISELGVYVIEDRRNRNASPTVCLSSALEGTRWSVGTVQSGTITQTADLSYYHTTALQAVQDICDTFGLEPVPRYQLTADHTRIQFRYIDLLQQQGSREPRRFDFGRNLAGLTRKVDPSSVITRLYPYGKGVPSTDETGAQTGGYGRKIDISSVNNGRTYIEDTDATALWGIPDANGQVQAAMGVQDYGEIEDPAELKRAALADLAKLSQPKASYTATVATLGVEGRDREAVGLGDDVQVVDRSFPRPVRVSGRVLAIKDSLVDPLGDNTTITLGNLTENYTSSQKNTLSQVNKLWQGFGAWNDAAGLRPSYIDGVIAGWNQEMNGTGGYVYNVPDEGIYVYNRRKDRNPTQAIQIGGGFFRIANRKNSDGSWRWRTMGSGAGLTADVIYTGTIKGGANWWNLETGDLLFERGNIRDTAGRTSWDLTTGTFIGRDMQCSGTFTNVDSSGTGVELENYELRGFQDHVKTLTIDPNVSFNSGEKGALIFGDAKWMGLGAAGQMYVTTSETDNGRVLAFETLHLCTDMESKGGGSYSWMTCTRTFVNGMMLGGYRNAATAATAAIDADDTTTETDARDAALFAPVTWTADGSPGIMGQLTDPTTVRSIVDSQPVYRATGDGYKLVHVPQTEAYANYPAPIDDDYIDVDSMSDDELCGITRVTIDRDTVDVLAALVDLSRNHPAELQSLISLAKGDNHGDIR